MIIPAQGGGEGSGRFADVGWGSPMGKVGVPMGNRRTVWLLGLFCGVGGEERGHRGKGGAPPEVL